MEISPYVVFRRSRLPVGELDEIRFTETWSRIDERRLLQAELDARSAELSLTLETVIGDLAEGSRRGVVALRRDIHNGRLRRAEAAFEEASGLLPDEASAAVRSWMDLFERFEGSAAGVASAVQEDRVRAGEHFKRLFRHDAMERSIQLSGRQLYQDLRDFSLERDARAKPAKVRVREASLVNYAYRAAFKPSPFGRFTEIGAFDPASPERGRFEPADGRARSVTTLNRFLLNWVLAAVPLVGDGLDIGDLVLNSTVAERAGTIEYLGVLPGSWRDGEQATERLVRVQADDQLRAVVRLLSDRPARGSAVLDELSHLNDDEPANRRFLQGLLRLGIIFYRPPVDDHDPRYSERLLAMLARGESDALAEIGDRLETIRELETRFADESAEGRSALLERAGAAVADIADIAGVAPPPQEVLRSLVFEDTPATGAPRFWDRGLIEAAKPALASLWRLGTALDTGQIRRIGLYSFACTVLPTEGGTLPFLDFFDSFSSLTPQEQADVYSGRLSPLASRFQEQRADALRRIREAAVWSEGEVRIAPEAIEEAIDRIEGLRDTESVTFRAQFAGDAGRGTGPALVVNGMLTGYGVYMSRFGSFVRPVSGWSLPEAQRTHLARRFPGQVDLNAVLGFNFNIHPSVCAAVVDYPGARTIGRGVTVHRPADLHVRIDHEQQAVRLWDPEASAFLDLVPMNFMTPYGVPLLYRLLEQMSPSNRYLWSPLRDIMGESLPAEGAPRLVVGDVIADRRAWVFPAGEVPDLPSLSRDDFDALERFDRWRRAKGIPQEGFVLCQTAEEEEVLAGRGGHASRSLADFAHIRRASVHKPMYVDFRNPYLVRSLAKSALSRPGVLITIRECLPGSSDYRSDPGSPAAEEYFLELFTE